MWSMPAAGEHAQSTQSEHGRWLPWSSLQCGIMLLRPQKILPDRYRQSGLHDPVRLKCI
jgi:hypothetical protein